MVQALNIEERIKIAIKLGESHFREFKSARQHTPEGDKPREVSAICKDIAESLVAFANADGGELIVGVEDNGSVTGIPHADDKVDIMIQAPRNHVISSTPLQDVGIGKLPLTKGYEGRGCLLYFSVPKSSQFIHQTSDGRCLQRHDRESHPVSAQQLQYEKQEEKSLEYDREFVDVASAADLQPELVNGVAEKIMKGASAEAVLQYLGLAEYTPLGIKLRRAALLLFAQYINRWHPRCQIRILRVSGTTLGVGTEYNIAKQELVEGNILTLLSSSWDTLRPYLAIERLGSGGLFRETLLYPEEACIEALVNAIAHRDYSLEGRAIEVFIFEDRMEIKSPGQLLSTVSIDDLRKLSGAHASRNPYISRVLKEVGFMRELGEGIPRIFRAMERQDMTPPDIVSEKGTFSISLFNRSVFSQRDQAWLNSYKEFNPTREEQRVLLLGKDGHLIVPMEIRKELKIIDTEEYRKIVESMLKKGLIYSVRSADRLKMQKQSGKQRREVGRFALRSIGELQYFYGELVKALARVSPADYISNYRLGMVLRNLPPNNPYGRNEIELRLALKYLGFIESNTKPSAKLIALWLKK